jgi:hypothetical protein
MFFFIFHKLFSLTVVTLSFTGGRDPLRTRAQTRLGLPPPDPQPSHQWTSEGHVANVEDTTSSTHWLLLNWQPRDPIPSVSTRLAL